MERPVTNENVTACPNVTTAQNPEISGNQRGEACDKNAPGRGGIMDLQDSRPRGIILTETQVHIRPQPIKLKKYYLEVKMKDMPPQYLEIKNHKIWKEIVTEPKKAKEYVEKWLNATLSDEDIIALKEEIVYYVYLARVHGRNAVILSRTELPTGDVKLALRRREDFPIYDEIPLVGETKYAIIPIVKWLGVRTKDKNGIPLDPGDLWDIFVELIKDGDICYEPCSLKQEEEEREEKELEEAAEELAEKILNAEDPIQAAIEKLFPLLGAGEVENRIILHTELFGARKMDEQGNVWKPALILVTGEPGGGKTWLCNTACGTLGVTLKRGRLTAHAFDYLDHRSYSIFYLQELRPEEAMGQGYIRFAASDDQGYEVEYVVREEGSGRFKTEVAKIPAKVIISTSHLIQFDPQTERRCWRLTVDDSPEATRQVKQWLTKIKAEEQLKKLGLRKWTSYELGKETWRKIWEKIQPREVVIPEGILSLITKYILTTDTLWERGDLNKIVDFLELFALWYYRRLPRLKINDEGEYVYVITPYVFVRAIRILRKYFGLSRQTGTDERVLRVLQLVQEITRNMENASLEEGGETVYIINKDVIEKIAERMKKSPRTIRRYLKAALETGLVDAAVGSDGRISHYILKPVDNNINNGDNDSKLWAEAWAVYNDFVKRFRNRIEEPDGLAAAFSYIFAEPDELRPKNERNAQHIPSLDMFVTAAAPPKTRNFRGKRPSDTVTSRDKPFVTASQRPIKAWTCGTEIA